MLCDTNDIRVEDEHQFQSMATSFYNIFTETSREDTQFQKPDSYPRVSQEYLNILSSDVNDTTVRHAVFDMGHWKSLGQDGYPTGFYQKTWDVIGLNTCIFVKINQTHIFLIPKVSYPKFINQFRPISLCNNLYKIIIKVVVNNLKIIIP